MKRKIIDFSLKEGSAGFSPEIPYKFMIRSFPRSDHVKLHYHDSLEINLYQGVEGQIFLNGREYVLKHHSLIILPPGTLHSYIIPAQEEKMIVLQISFTHINRFFNVDEVVRAMGILWERIPFFTEEPEIPIHCYGLMDKNPISLPDFLIWMIELLKTLALLGQQKTGALSDSLSLGWLRKTIAYTEREFHRKLPLSELAELTGFHSSYFSRLFKKHTGLNYKDYLQNVRLGRSLELLEEGISVSEAAELSGYQDVSYFIKVFKENHGITPYTYQKLLKK